MSEAPESKCSLLGGSFSLAVQAFLAITCVATLAVKRMNEYPQRDWSIWSLDVSKQGFGSAIGHTSNLFIATLLSASKSADECEFYCVCYLTDVTIGTVLNVSLLSLTERVLLANTPHPSMFKFGDYGDPPSIATWLIQLIIWLTIIIITKILLVFFLIFSFDYLNAAISFAFSFLIIYPKVELIVVMIMIPFVFNILAFWITDSFLKKTEFLPIAQLEDTAASKTETETEDLSGLEAGESLEKALLSKMRSFNTETRQRSPRPAHRSANHPLSTT